MSVLRTGKNAIGKKSGLATLNNASSCTPARQRGKKKYRRKSPLVPIATILGKRARNGATGGWGGAEQRKQDIFSRPLKEKTKNRRSWGGQKLRAKRQTSGGGGPNSNAKNLGSEENRKVGKKETMCQGLPKKSSEDQNRKLQLYGANVAGGGAKKDSPTSKRVPGETLSGRKI